MSPTFPASVRTIVLMSAVMLGASAAAGQTADGPQAPPAFVVAPFETDRTGWMPPPRLGETLAELLIARLAADGVRVIDRSWLPASTDASTSSAGGLFARVASHGVDYLILGSVTRLSIERSSSARAGLLPVPVAAGLIRRRKVETVVGLNVRIVNVGTGEIVGSVTSHGGDQHQSTSGGGLTIISKLPLVGGSHSSVTGVQDRLLDDAVQEAIGVAAEQISAVAQRAGRGEP